MEYLIIGNPRCGSGYSAKTFTRLGIPTIHENPPSGKKISEYRAHSSWAYNITNQPDDEYPKYGLPSKYIGENIVYGPFGKTIVYLRNPFDAFPSLIDENRVDWSKFIRFSHITRVLGIEINGNELEQCILSYIYFNKIALDKCDFYFRIEYDFEKLNVYLKKYHKDLNILTDKEINQKVNSKPNSRVFQNRDSYDSVSWETKKMLKDFCDEYGYEYIL